MAQTMLALVLHKTITIPLKCVKYDNSALWSHGLPPPFPEPLRAPGAPAYA